MLCTGAMAGAALDGATSDAASEDVPVDAGMVSVLAAGPAAAAAWAAGAAAAAGGCSATWEPEPPPHAARTRPVAASTGTKRARLLIVSLMWLSLRDVGIWSGRRYVAKVGAT